VNNVVVMPESMNHGALSGLLSGACSLALSEEAASGGCLLSEGSPEEVLEIMEDAAGIELIGRDRGFALAVLRGMAEGTTVADFVRVAENVPDLRKFAWKVGAIFLADSSYKAIFEAEFGRLMAHISL